MTLWRGRRIVADANLTTIGTILAVKHPPRNIDMTCFNWVKLVLKTDLNHHAKYLGLYLSTYMNLNQDMAFPSLKRIQGETGLGHATVLKYLDLLITEGWLVKQSGTHIESNRYWINIPNASEIRVGREPTYVASRGRVGREPTSNNNIITNTTTTTTPDRPTVEDVSNYVRTRSIKIDPQHFVDYYTANGWKVGRNSMKDWKAAVRTWEKRENGNTKNTTGQHSNQGRLSAGDRTRQLREERERTLAARASDLGRVVDNA